MQSDSTPKSARERILLSAHQLFYGEGIRATGIDRIIREAGVTKLTFYRHFPSKNDLIRAYLEYRHDLWMAWFQDALQRHAGRPPETIVAALREWFGMETFRGCAFINSVVEMDAAIPEVGEISRRHKLDMEKVLAELFGTAPDHPKVKAVALAIDGAIIRAQIDKSAAASLTALALILSAL